ncbi:type I restriction endonuclease [Halovenus salina]|uniref:type I site-specific deoxyribonuclease n=1 Tax=Halovenus salina TaxID=1510225 RepID=A0ABD5W8B8_9EURY
MGLDELELAEKPAIEIFRDLGYDYASSTELSTSRPTTSEVVLKDRLRDQVKLINPDLPEDAREEAIRHLTSTQSPNLLEDNQELHQQLVDGVQVEYEQDGEQVGRFVQPIDFENPENNDWLVTTQFTVQVGDNPRRKPDLVVFLNGLPIGVLEFKNPTDPKATLENAYDQVNSRYRNDISPLFRYNEVIGLADLNESRIGCLDAGWQWYRPWRYIEQEEMDARICPDKKSFFEGCSTKNAS